MKRQRSRVAGNRPKLESGKAMSAERPPTNRPWRGARDAAHARLLVARRGGGRGRRGRRAADRGVGIGRERERRRALLAASRTNTPERRRRRHRQQDAQHAAACTGRSRARSTPARSTSLRADHAGTIVYDVQFTTATSEAQDLALYRAIARAGNVVLATTEIGPHGETNVLGGDANLARAHARAGAANFRANSSGVIQRYPYVGRGPALGRRGTVPKSPPASRSRRRASNGDSAWIDFPGPVGTVPNVSFVDLIHGRVPPAAIAGKVVVVGATSPVLQDLHATSVTSSTGMSGPEVQAERDRDGAGRQPAAPDPDVDGGC